MDVTILGGTGLLGKKLSSLLVDRGHRVTITGRRAEPDPGPRLTGVSADLASGKGLQEAIAGAEVVVHCASDPLLVDEVDVAGTRRLLDVLGDRHLVYVSIVGVDRHPLPYYQGKLATERMIEESSPAHSVVRATQFHDFIAYRMEQMTRKPIAAIPAGYVYQPIDVSEVAEHLASVVEGPPLGRAPDLGGPEISRIEDLARTYMRAKGRVQPMVTVRGRGPVADAYRAGYLTNHDRAVGRLTWEGYLERRFSR